ncbi:MAG: peptidylprolyl isomerase [Planctomycetota bacterium]
MKRSLSLSSFVVLGLMTAGGVSPSAGASTIVRFDTSLGDIDVRLYDTATPDSVANFLNYVTTDRYDGTFFHRVPQSAPGVSADFVVQGGGFLLNDSIFGATGIVTDAPIGDEPGLTNTRATLAFAKNSLGATSQYFFNIGDNSFLDAQDFTVFGHVINDTLPVVDAINNLPTINAAAAEDAPGEDFDEVPVTDFDQVLAQNDITNSEAVLVNNVTVLNFADGDYNFDGGVDRDDFEVWESQFGSSVRIADQVGTTPDTFAEADGNGDGVVDVVDLEIWRAAAGILDGDYNGDGFVGQADLNLVLLNFGDSVLPEGFDVTGLTGGPFDGLIGQNELNDVLLNFGNSAAPAVAVPEPASLALLGLGAAAGLARRRR